MNAYIVSTAAGFCHLVTTHIAAAENCVAEYRDDESEQLYIVSTADANLRALNSALSWLFDRRDSYTDRDELAALRDAVQTAALKL